MFHHLCRQSPRAVAIVATVLGLTALVQADDTPDAARPLKPTIASPWFRIVEYPTNHLNDFCLFRDQQGVWHAIGIMGTGTWASETALFHSTGRSLRERFENLEPLFAEMPEWIGEKRSGNKAPQKQAPFVVFDNGFYHMFYRRPPGSILAVRSADAYRWPNRVELAFESEGCARSLRDPRW